MSRRRKKRLVGWLEYGDNICMRTAMYVLVGLCAVGGLWFLIGGITCIFVGVSSIGPTSIAHGGMLSGGIAMGVGIVIGGIGVLGIWAARSFARIARHAAPVELLTKSSAKHLPEAETLVRGSDRPKTAEQIELLRAVRQSPASSPPEQLLRATQENRQDV